MAKEIKISKTTAGEHDVFTIIDEKSVMTISMRYDTQDMRIRMGRYCALFNVHDDLDPARVCDELVLNDASDYVIVTRFIDAFNEFIA